jgi:hypothetical protein
MQFCGQILMFGRNMLPPSSGLRYVGLGIGIFICIKVTRKVFVGLKERD